jgi:hypothetical protein
MGQVTTHGPTSGLTQETQRDEASPLLSHTQILSSPPAEKHFVAQNKIATLG